MLINCVVYRDGARLADIPTADISDYLARPDCFVWVALRDATDAELEEMQQEFGLHDLTVEDARHGHQRPKIEEYGESLFVVMHLLEISKSDIVTGEVNVFVGKNFILSIRNHSQQHLLNVRERCEREPERLRQGPGFVLYALMDAVVDRYFPVLNALESRLDDIEERIFEKGAARDNIRQLYELKRKIAVIKHAVSPLMDEVSNLLGSWAPAVCANNQDYFRDVYDHLVRINTSIDTLRDTVNTAILVCQSTVTIEQNETNKRLAAWAGIFGIATVLAGIWGMNFSVMPELQWKYGYPAALLFIAAAAGLLYLRFKRSGWL
ncbi:MAG: magnesium/cobalt transporter CorA [Acetobacteraceae bacterium]|uniref:magnesium/cobalt transporter CorA n=1 Tax=Bradyrhizobium sp. TaxID=376 RepID=UPI003D11B2D4